MSLVPGLVFRRPDRPDALLVVLSSEQDNHSTGWVTVCAYNLTGLVGDLPDASRLHSLTPSPGYVAYTLHFSVPASTLREPIGSIETAALATARVAMAARFSS